MPFVAFHNILSKVDRALVAYIEQELGTDPGDSGANAFPGKSSFDKAAPCTICFSEHAVEDPPYSANFTIRASVEVRSPAAIDVNQDAEEVRLASELRVAETFDLFHDHINQAGDKLGEDITSAARALAGRDFTNNRDLTELTIQNVSVQSVEAGFDEKHDGSVWVDRLNLEVQACPADVS